MTTNNIDVFSLAWKLRTHPFLPTCDPLGNPITIDLSRPLSPSNKQNQNLMHLYFDIYKWEESPYIGQLSITDGLAQFPNLDDIAANEETFVAIVSGKDLTGVRSMVNLIHYRALQNSSIPPLFFSGRLNNQKIDGWTRTIIKLFNDSYHLIEPLPTYQDLKAIYDEEIAELKNDPSGYLNLPQRIHNLVRLASNRPIVFTMDIKDNLIFEQWSSIYEIVRGFVNLLIIPTRNSDDASIFFTAKHTEIRIAHIESKKLDQTKARNYLAARLQNYRLQNLSAGLPDIAPFSDNSLERLFKPGSNSAGNSSVAFPIGWLNKRLRAAMDKHLDNLIQFSQANGITDFGSIPTQQLLIQPSLVDEVIAELNQG